MKIILPSLILFFIANTKAYCQINSKAAVANQIDELAYKVSKSPVYSAFTKEVATVRKEITLYVAKINKEKLKGHSKQELEAVLHNKSLNQKQRRDSLKNMGLNIPVVSTSVKRLEIARNKLYKAVPELSKLSKDKMKLVMSKAFTLFASLHNNFLNTIIEENK